jgi:PAS domain S-box-containing protein
MKILIVEDDPDSRVMLQNILESGAHQVLSAANGVQALTNARREQPDLIISDIMMPEMDGFELCYTLKHDPELEHIPVIFCTATYVDSADERLALQLGAERFMLKPIEPQQLLDTVAEFEHQRPPREHASRPQMQDHLGHEEFLRRYNPRITRKLDEKIRELELYKNIYHNSSDLFCILSPSGTALQANSAFRRFFACTSTEELKHLNLGDFILKPDFCELLTTVQRHKPFQTEVRALTPAGAEACLEISALPFVDENTNLNAIVLQGRDITERCRHAEELEMLRRLIDISNDAIFVINADDGTFKYVNDRACERLGYTRPELLGLHVMDIVVEFNTMEDWHAHVNHMQHNPTAVFESVHICKDGSHLPVEVSIMHDQSKEHPPLISAVARDITERLQARKQHKKLEAELNQARTMEALGTLAGGVAHDFNNIIGAISGYTEMAQRNLHIPAKVETCLAQVSNASHRARDLVKQILAFSRRSEQNLSPVRLEDIIREVLDLLRPNVPEGIRIEFTNANPDTTVIADPGQMHQVIMNLCTNALHAMEEHTHGTLHLSLDKVPINGAERSALFGLAPGTYIQLQVHDTGSGMDEETRVRLFEPYFSTRKKQGGTGLGLAMVHGIIKGLSGSIKVDSAPGQGSVFSILLPAAHPESNPLGGPEEKEISPGGARKNAEQNTSPGHVLVVDDDEATANLTARMLEAHGYAVACITSSPEALEVFRRHKDRFIMLITDYAMPDMSGVELARQVRRIRADIPVIMYSGYYAGEEQRDACAAGIEMVLNKPLQDYQLTLAVDSILSTRNRKA